MISARAMVLTLLLTLVACGKTPDSATSPGAASLAKTAMPSDPKLAKLYGQTCRSCHAYALSGAPLTHDKAEWEARMKQGAATLLEHTIDGYKGMPPMGACSDCSEADFNALIAFMAGGQ